MLIELEGPLLLIKHRSGLTESCHEFEVWYVPIPEPGSPMRKRGVRLHIFKGEFDSARSECRKWLDIHHRNTETLWTEGQ